MTVRFHRPGDLAPKALPGDVVLTHSPFLTGRLIRLGQRLRFRGARRQFAFFNHAALVVAAPRIGSMEGAAGHDGEIVEALGHGVERNRLDKYRDTEYALVSTTTGPEDVRQILRFADAVLEAKTRYDFLEIVSLGLTLLTPGIPIQFGSPGTSICSGLVAEALTRAGHIFGTSPEYAMPADLAEHFGVGLP